MQTCFLYAAAVQLYFLDVIQTPGLPLSLSDIIIFHMNYTFVVIQKTVRQNCGQLKLMIF